MIAYHHISDARIAMRQHPAMLIGFARNREVSEAKILLDTGIDIAATEDAHRMISPQQYLRLLMNVTKALDANDTSFLIGEQMLPGHIDGVSHALLHAGSLREALEILIAYATQLSPLMCPRLNRGKGWVVVYWMDSYGAPAQRSVLTEMHMAALVAMCRWLSGERLPWRFCFNRRAPRYIEQYEVHLGSEMKFNCHFDAMLIEEDMLDRRWPRGNPVAVKMALQASVAEQKQNTPSLLNALYDYLLKHIRCAPTLDQAAQEFFCSPATLKRYLAKHGTHFQAELDQVRSHAALHLFLTQQIDNEAVAQHLGFHDANNFRRSFKRWTGLTPSLIREGMLADLAKWI